MAEEHPEFFDYVERMEDEKMFQAHQEWQQNSFFGKLVSSTLSWAQNNEFFGAIAKSFADPGSDVSPYARTAGICVTMGIVIVGVIALFAIGRIVQVVIGKEIVVEQKVFVETQIKLSDLMKEDGEVGEQKGENEEDSSRRNKKSKVQ